MSTLKSDGIQPTLTTNNLIIRSGADVERLRIQPDGQILVASTTGTTFAGEVNFSNTIRIPGGVQVGGGIGPTRYTALDVVTSNTGLGLPDAANYNTTRSRSNMMVKPSGSVTNGDITLFMGSSASGSWLQVQAETGNTVKNLLLNPAGGDVVVGGGGINNISCATAPTLGQHLANKSYVDNLSRIGTTAVFMTSQGLGSNATYGATSTLIVNVPGAYTTVTAPSGTRWLGWYLSNTASQYPTAGIDISNGGSFSTTTYGGYSFFVLTRVS